MYPVAVLMSARLLYLGLLKLRSRVLSSPSSKSIAVLEVLVDCGGMAPDGAHLFK